MHRFIDSSTHLFVDSLLQWFAGSLIHRLIDSLIHWFTEWAIHWFTDSLSHWIIDALIHGLTDSLISLLRCFIGSLVHSVSCVWILSRHVISISATICSFVDAPRNFDSSLLLHRKNFPIGHWFLITISYFRNFCPGACRALSGTMIYLLYNIVCVSVCSAQLYTSFHHSSKRRVMWCPRADAVTAHARQ